MTWLWWSRPAYIIGDPRYDNYPDYPESRKADFFNEFGLKKDKPLILWLSTRVDWQSRPDANITLWLDEFLTLGTHFNLVLRPHPHRVRDNPGLMEKIKKSGLILDLKAEREMNQLFKSADYIISDFGSSIFSAVYLDCNLLLFNHPEQHRTTKFMELKIRKDIINLDPRTPGARDNRLVKIFRDPATWAKQKEIRKKWRNQLFGGIIPGQGAITAASVLKKIFSL
ncbi:CDP-glycerol glycerophosphotransferase family protein [Desulfonatronovibrio magnus]|uniref:CDP-glycerol glycerophosphotransferase family protein n=1 Tax=Desulfonatronovibrio magnus TaxID=698827 RepID=UPI0005EB0E71|nr:CDP-glycerol glycerophosphotransferase family protein [Desulfonatronovibrio magnus]